MTFRFLLHPCKLVVKLIIHLFPSPQIMPLTQFQNMLFFVFAKYLVFIAFEIQCFRTQLFKSLRAKSSLPNYNSGTCIKEKAIVIKIRQRINFIIRGKYIICITFSIMDLDHFDPKSYRIPFQEEQKWREYLKNNGFVVIANYVPREKCQQYVRNFWDIMEVLTQNKLKRQDPNTHGVNELYPPVLHGGMIQYVGHSKPQWELRKMCKPIFQKIWNTNNVKTSFDGFCFMNGARKYEKRLNNAFLHCDQSPIKNYLWSVQGIMTLTDSKQNQGGFVCVPQSHNFHHKYFQQKNLLTHKKDWYKVPEQDKTKQPLCYDMKLDTQAGDFILFDSRTFHCNTVPTIDCLRVCTYICMLPSKNIEERILQGRKKAVEELRTTSHHPGDGFRTFAELPNQAKAPELFKELVRKVNDFVMDQEIAELI